MKFTLKKQMMSGVALLAMAAPGYVQAAEDAAAENELRIDEITVTATLRAANVQDVPISVAVLGMEQIDKADIHDADGIANSVPGMHFAEFAPGQAQFAMRGVGSFDDGAGLDNSVALFLDGVYIGRGAGLNFDMFDLERIEVLKGPQGALFGRNTIGGAISVVTQKPGDELEGKIAVTGGNEGTIRAQGMITGPITEKLSGKAVVNYRKHDGYVRNTFLNKDVNDENQISARMQLRLDLDSSEWILSADYMDDSREDGGRFPVVNGNFDYIGVATALGANKPQTTAAPIEGSSDREVYGVSLKGEVNFDKGTLTSISAYRSVETAWGMPSVGAPLGGGYDIGAGVFGADVLDDIDEEIDTFSQELRWTSELDGDFGFVAGAFFFKEKTDRVEQFKIDRNTTATGQVTVGNEYTRSENDSTSYALYGQAQWDFAPQWSLLAGGRYSHDEKDYVATAVNCGQTEAERAAAGFPNFSACDGAGGSLRVIAETFRAPVQESWDDFSPMASLQYRPNDNVMIFGTVSTGYKSGGFAGSQGVEIAATRAVKPESVINYEVGFKSDLADGRLRLNGSAFYMDYTDLQVVRFGPVPGSTFGSFQTTNIGAAKILGLELEFTWAVTEDFTLSGGYAYLDTEAKELVIEGRSGPVDYSGLTLRQAPKNSFNVVADYDLDLSDGNGSLNFNADLTHTDSSHNDFATAAQTLNQAKTLLGGSITWTSASENFKLSAWAKNLTNKSYVAHAYFIGPGTIGTWGAPRTFGLTGTYSF
ncbi:TonB-dependent receptor [Paremcibacter congregatus]|uniref:TonB-dependent receptor n=1 Tax=Paremcibacter congregatus TaxID=2043170 RepID=A0A2G4YSL5_9PROT|nr:TonB-dependent receptor [Paremcibacter congregatus]PHZ84436.1 TonB-dependent receptor [Paremcibacter congregatus]QDE28654.1 TonB-dependent receptor [Paremcibacter congregatus]